MSTTQQQTSQFAPSGMGAYNQIQPSLGNTLSWYLGGGQGGPNAPGSPFRSSLFQAGMGQGMTQAAQQGQTALSNIGQNAAGFGGGGTPGFLQSQVRQAGYGTSALQQNAYWNALNSTVSSQLGAAGQAAGYRPLQTGSSQTTTGLGSWLPQVLGAGLSLGLGGLNSLGGSGAGLGAMTQGMVGQTPGELGLGSSSLAGLNLGSSLGYQGMAGAVPGALASSSSFGAGGGSFLGGLAPLLGSGQGNLLNIGQ